MDATMLVQCNCEICAQTTLLALHRGTRYMVKYGYIVNT